MKLEQLTACHSFINKKIGMSSVLGPNKIIDVSEADLFFDTLTALRTMQFGLNCTRLKIQNLNDNTLLTLSPLVVDYEYFNPMGLYEKLFKDHLLTFPTHARNATREIINLAATSISKPHGKIRFQFVRDIGDQLYAKFPMMPRKVRIANLSDYCQLCVFGNRFMFIAYGDVGSVRQPQGHMDLFGIDLMGVVENYINGLELHTVGFKLPTLLSFKNVPIPPATGQTVKVEELNKPVKHTWIELLGKNVTTHEAIALDFNSIAQNYVNNPQTSITDECWLTIKKMIKFTGEQNVSCGIKTSASRAKFKQAS